MANRIKIKGVGVVGAPGETSSRSRFDSRRRGLRLVGRLWARRVSRCVPPTWPTHRTHTHASLNPGLSLPRRRASSIFLLLSSLFTNDAATSNYTLGEVMFETVRVPRPSLARKHIPVIPARRVVLKFPITDNDAQRLMAARANLPLRLSLSPPT